MCSNTINITRERILAKGYANQTDVRKFLGVGTQKAIDIFNLLREEAEDEGYIVTLGISPKRLIKFLGISENDIHRYAGIEREVEAQKKATAATVT